MKQSLYERFSKEELILRDYLAIDRTNLANENSILAYIRTALTFFISGISLIKFFNYLVVNLIGWALLILGIATMIIGIINFRNMSKTIRRIRD